MANGRVILSNLSKVIYDPTSCNLSGSIICIVWSSDCKDALPPLSKELISAPRLNFISIRNLFGCSKGTSVFSNIRSTM
uniref:Acid phosphatase, putative n=1 Tax=Arundo donax TaxID=35708 RepID=A0A0A9HUK5_ARUDO